MTDSVNAYPIQYRVITRKADTWAIRNVSRLCGVGKGDPNDIEALFGIRPARLCIELFRLNGGEPGYYLANLRDRLYYYCGPSSAAVKQKLLDLGIGRADPQEHD